MPASRGSGDKRGKAKAKKQNRLGTGKPEYYFGQLKRVKISSIVVYAAQV